MNRNTETIAEVLSDEESEDNISQTKGSEGLKGIRTTGFRNIVKRLQFAARLSKINQNDRNDCYNEDLKLRSKSVRRRFSKTLCSRQTSCVPSMHGRDSIGGVSAADKKTTYIKGQVNFYKADCHYHEKPFVIIDTNTPLNDIGYIFKDDWNLEAPKIITYVITRREYHSQWKNMKQIQNFKNEIAKAAMSTNMWILTNGLNCGVTSYVCSAVENEICKNKHKSHFKMESLPLLIGIAFEDELTYGHRLSNIDAQKNVCVENLGYSYGDKFELNPYHSHYIILKNKLNKSNSSDFILKLINFLIKGEEFYSNFYNRTENSRTIEIPLVSILVEGGPENASMILSLVKKQMPLVVLQGSGGMADIIAYAHMRIWNAFASNTAWDPDYIEEYIKPLVAQKISLQFTELANNFMACNMIREQVIECIRLSKQEGRDYLTVLDMYNINSCNLTNLSEDLLSALLKSRHNRGDSLKEHFLKDFELTVDWNCANAARNLCSNSATDIDSLKSKFFNVLIRDNREDFVDVFLSSNFKVHKFLSPGRLSRLFRAIHEDEFFHTVCWETALGQSSNAKQGKFFIENDLNWLIEFCTGLENYVNTEELHHNSLGIYQGNDSRSAERKALVLLAIWAVMHNRYKLVEVLWKYTDHPVHLALIISMLFERLSWHVLDTNLKAELTQKSKKFADYANDVLDRCYNENISLAYNVLRESIRDFNFMTAVDIAANAQLKQFIAHPCCQKWLTNTFQGNIRLREIGWGFFTIPIYLKILLCSILIFPMYIWVRFKSQNLDSTVENAEIEDDFDIYDKIYDNPEQVNFENTNGTGMQSASVDLSSNDISMVSTGCYTNKAFDAETQYTHKAKTKRFLHHIHHREVFVKKQPPLWQMIKMMWCSPITKFYTSQLFYVIFLIILSLTTLYPNCGNRILDSIVCSWSFLFAISCIRHTYILFIKYPSVSIYPKITEIMLILAFTATVATTRLLECHHLYPFYWQKVVLSLAVLYFYYRLITIYLPISPTMGPLLHRVRLMITVDFVNYLRITLVILISNSIVIRALMFPTRELDVSFVTTVIHKGILALFDSPPSGTINVTTEWKKQVELCHVQPLNSTEPVELVKEDPFIIYFFVFQFYIILRLIFGPLLFSIFAVTASKWVAEIDSIWKFQRYHLVIDFANRLSLPEPLSLFYYIYLIFYYLTYIFSKSLKSPDGKRKNSYNYSTPLSLNIISPEDCYYWKQLAAEYIDTENKKTEESQVTYREWERVQEISEEIEYEKKVLREIKVKIGELEKMLQPGSGVRDTVAGWPHWTTGGMHTADKSYLSRVSPYPDTTITRFPLPRKYLSWQIAFYAYEPTCYTLRFDQFPPHMRPFVDEDILKMKEDSLRARHSSSRLAPSYKWNDKEIDKSGLVIDRRSWCEASSPPQGAEQPSPLDVMEASSRSFVKYQLEDHFLPLNPYGRTGIRGKGALVRWGPNHYSILIITQVISPKGKSATKQVQLLLERREQSSKLELIERYINNQDEVYKIFGEAFNVSKQIVQNKLDLRDDLTHHFGSNSVEVNCRLVQSGYFDSSLNTDNAWKEADVYLVQLEGNVSELASRVTRVKPVEAGTHAEWFPADEQALAGLLDPSHSQLLNYVWTQSVD